MREKLLGLETSFFIGLILAEFNLFVILLIITDSWELLTKGVR